MSILNNISNVLKTVSQILDVGNSVSALIPQAKTESPVSDRYLANFEDNPLHSVAQKNSRMAEDLGYCSGSQTTNQCSTKSSNVNQSSKEFLKDPRVRALLDTIAYAEGTAKDADQGYGRIVNGSVVRASDHPELVGQKNATTTDFSDHPRAMVKVNSKLYSSAAGRYQFTQDTWDSLHLGDFSPESQDLGALMLLQRRNALEPLLHDDLDQAIQNINKEWASLPGSPYGQPTKNMEQIRNVYNEALSFYLGQQGAL